MRRADIFLVLRREGEAVQALAKARIALRGQRESDLLVYVLARQAEALSRSMQWREVSEICGEGISLVERFRYKVTPQNAQSSYLRLRISLYTLGVRAAYETGEFALALERAELAKCRSVLLYQGRGEVDDTSDHKTLEQEFKSVCQQIDEAQKHARSISEALRSRRRVLWDLLTIQRFQMRVADALPQFSIPAVQAVLGSGDAILYYFRIDAQTLLTCVLDRSDFVLDIRTLPPEAQLALEDYIATFLEKGEGDLVSIAHVLWPKGDHLLSNNSRLFFSPHQMLHAIPFHALRFEGKYLIRRFAVGYIPSLTSLLLPSRTLPQPRVLALGIADYKLEGLQPLPDAETEVREIAAIYRQKEVQTDLLLGPEALEENLLTSDLSKYTCLHFATHGQNVESDTPMESYMYLFDSKLEAIEIANWKLRADLVVLSACSSGQRAIRGRGMEQLPGDDLLGLQAAFFTAGTRRVLCTLRPVRSKAARKLMVAFHTLLTGGMEPEFALQAAVKQYLGEAEMLHREPSYWAPFFIALAGNP